MTKLLSTILAGLLLGAVSAQAALTFSAVPSASSVVKSVPQAQRFAAYLAHRLGEPVDLRVFLAETELRAALKETSVIDLAMLQDDPADPAGSTPLAQPTARAEAPAATGRLVARAGMDQTLRGRLEEVLANMENDPGGQELLYDMGLQRLAPVAGGTRKMMTGRHVPAGTATTPRRSGAAGAASGSSAGTALTLGMVTDADTPLRSQEAAGDFARTLSQHLGVPVNVRNFQDRAELFQWLSRYRMIDLALLPESALQSLAGSQGIRLAQPRDLYKQGLAADLWLVARPGLPARQLTALTSGLSAGQGAPPAVSPPPPVSAPRVPGSTPPQVVRHPPSSPEAGGSRPSAGRGGARLILGTASGTLFRDAGQAQAFARLLGDRLGTVVTTQTFADQATLRQWLDRHRMVDLGVFDAAYLRQQPAGTLIPLLPAGALGRGDTNLVARQGLPVSTQKRLRDTLQRMQGDPEVLRLFQEGTIGPPTPAPSTPPVAKAESKPPVVAPPMPVAPPTPAPSAPPVVKTEPKPASVAAPPKLVVPPAPASSTPPVAEAEPKPPVVAPPKPVVPPTPAPSAPPVAKAELQPPVAEPARKPEPRPALPEDRTEVFLVPFTTVMVPDAVVETIFDTFVEALNAEGMDQRFEFTILKGGLDSVDQVWLNEHSYVTGEIFGYVEESGCCSTDIRTKSRVFFYRAGSATPAMQHEYPVKSFFDHDYSTLEKERRKIADNIAAELAGKVRAALSGS